MALIPSVSTMDRTKSLRSGNEPPRNMLEIHFVSPPAEVPHCIDDHLVMGKIHYSYATQCLAISAFMTTWLHLGAMTDSIAL